MSGAEFVQRINELVCKIDKPKADFYQYVGIAKNSLTNWSKRNTIPGADVAVRIAQYLNTSVEYLVTGKEEQIPREVIDFAYETFALPPILQNIMFDTLESCKRQRSIQAGGETYAAG